MVRQGETFTELYTELWFAGSWVVVSWQRKVPVPEGFVHWWLLLGKQVPACCGVVVETLPFLVTHGSLICA